MGTDSAGTCQPVSATTTATATTTTTTTTTAAAPRSKRGDLHLDGSNGGLDGTGGVAHQARASTTVYCCCIGAKARDKYSTLTRWAACGWEYAKAARSTAGNTQRMYVSEEGQPVHSKARRRKGRKFVMDLLTERER